MEIKFQMKTYLVTSKQSKFPYVPYYVNWRDWQKTHFQLAKMHFSTPPESVHRLNREISCSTFLYTWVLKIRTVKLYQKKNVQLTHCSRVRCSKFGCRYLLRQISGKRMEIKFQMKTHLVTTKQSKIFVCTMLCELQRLA
jgi:hypothetical protein